MQYLLINQSSPFVDYTAQESLDLALALCTFEQTVQLLFIGNGVLQLLKNQKPNLTYRKDFAVTFKALPLYEIINVYVDSDSLIQHNICKNDLLMDVTVVDKKDVVKIIEEVDIILNV